jgi:hypothetical protein
MPKPGGSNQGKADMAESSGTQSSQTQEFHASYVPLHRNVRCRQPRSVNLCSAMKPKRVVDPDCSISHSWPADAYASRIRAVEHPSSPKLTTLFTRTNGRRGGRRENRRSIVSPTMSLPAASPLPL